MNKQVDRMLQRGTTMTVRKTRISISLMALVLVLGAIAVVAIAPAVTAEPIQTGASMDARVKAQKEACIDGGGKVESSKTILTMTVKCVGGSGIMGGKTCVNTRDTVDCYVTYIPPTQAPFGGPSDTADPNAADPPAATPITTDLADPGLIQVADPGVSDPTPTPAPKRPPLRPTMEPVLDPLDQEPAPIGA